VLPPIAPVAQKAGYWLAAWDTFSVIKNGQITLKLSRSIYPEITLHVNRTDQCCSQLYNYIWEFECIPCSQSVSCLLCHRSNRRQHIMFVYLYVWYIFIIL
jgi:hypothetical protein